MNYVFMINNDFGYLMMTFLQCLQLLYNYQAKGKTTISSKRQRNLHVYIYSQL